jgi:uncharacterized protein (TIGR03083 family)
VKNHLDYLHHLAAESARFGEVFRDVPPDARVPACPDWNADDLLWHLAEVQWFWGTVVRENLTGPQVRENNPPRPEDRAGLLDFYRSASGELGRALAAVSPETPAWTWNRDQSVGFIQRRQAHEALIHRLDAEEAAGRRTGMDPLLSADGIDETLRVMYGGLPDWGMFTPDGDRLIRLQAADTGDSWLVALGRFTGTDSGGTSYDEPDFHVEDDDLDRPTIALISAGAADLDCWLWHRSPIGPVDLTGDETALSDFQAIIAPGLG